MSRAYYSATVSEFLTISPEHILGVLASRHEFALEDLQRNAWTAEISLLKRELANVPNGDILFEYSIPRMGKRADVIVLNRGIIFVLEFKVGESNYTNAAIEQALDYAVDLKNFHEKSHNLAIVPIVVATKAISSAVDLRAYPDGVYYPILSNGNDLGKIVLAVSEQISNAEIGSVQWEDSRYKPTPTIIEAAQALYRKHDVHDISRSEAGVHNLSMTSDAVIQIIEKSKTEKQKSICFVTGVPGAGKTLAGLNIANKLLEFGEDEHAIFLSGNGPLVTVLREALARDEVTRSRLHNLNISKKVAHSRASAFIQNIHHFRDDAIRINTPPIERVVIFDEAQRAWTKEQTSFFMRRKKGIEGFDQSEPDFLISILDRHPDWAVIICLIGSGQEINTGEAGIKEWFHAIAENYSQWNVYLSNEIGDVELVQGKSVQEILPSKQVRLTPELHLSVSLRSFRSERVSEFVRLLLANEADKAKAVHLEISKQYPILVTRDINIAKNWLRLQARGSERIGILASSGGKRLRGDGIFVSNDIDIRHWLLNGKEDVRSSYYLEDVATEFDIQGLELDWTCVAWDADLRYRDGNWIPMSFKGTRWQRNLDEARVNYLRNSYRVLLTRARQGMVLFVPKGEDSDVTRTPEFYNGTYEFLVSLGVPEI